MKTILLPLFFVLAILSNSLGQTIPPKQPKKPIELTPGQELAKAKKKAVAGFIITALAAIYPIAGASDPQMATMMAAVAGMQAFVGTMISLSAWGSVGKAGELIDKSLGKTPSK